MKLASMTIVKKNGVRYDANVITVGVEDHTDVGGHCQLCEQPLHTATMQGPLG